MKSIVDYISDSDINRYNELIAMASEAKANAPKAPRGPRGPMTAEQKKKAAQRNAEKWAAKLAALEAQGL